MAHPVVHFEILGNDGKRLQQFYAELFGWNIDAGNAMQYGQVEPVTGGSFQGIGGGIAQGQKPLVTIYVQASDLDATLRKAETLGGKTITPPMEVPGGPTIAAFADPDGNTIGLVQG